MAHEEDSSTDDYFDDGSDAAARHAVHKDCPLSDLSYYRTLHDSLIATFTGVENAEVLAKLIYLGIIAENRSSDSIYDPLLYQASLIAVQRLASVASGTTAESHALLWCSIQSFQETDFLAKLVDGEASDIPECILSRSLLPLAASLRNDQAVEILLRKGADPNVGESLFCSLKHLSFLDNGRSSASNPWKVRLTKTVQILIENGARLVPLKPASQNPPIFGLVPLSSHNLVDTADVIMSLADPRDLNYAPEGNSFNGYQPQTVLTMAVIAFKQRFFVNPVPERLLLSMERLGRTRAIAILKHVILPAVKAGAQLPRDILDYEHGRMDDWFNYYRSLILLPDSSPSVSEYNDPWVLYYYRLLLEARMKSSLNVANFQKFVDQYRNRFREREHQFATLVLGCRQSAGCHGFYPRSLQSQCRTKLLRDCLPGGLNKRTAAVGSLNLPRCLMDYLLFADFDLPLRQLELYEAKQQSQD